jgi:hypothetical protein
VAEQVLADLGIGLQQLVLVRREPFAERFLHRFGIGDLAAVPLAQPGAEELGQPRHADQAHGHRHLGEVGRHRARHHERANAFVMACCQCDGDRPSPRDTQYRCVLDAGGVEERGESVCLFVVAASGRDGCPAVART